MMTAQHALSEAPQLQVVTVPPPSPAPIRNAVLLQADAARLPLASNSVMLIPTSPPYNVGWPYLNHDDDRPIDEYLASLAAILRECYRVLAPGGTLAWNVPPTTRRPDERAFPLAAWCQMHLRETGWLLSEPIIWVKAGRNGQPLAHSRAFGAMTIPYFRPTYEHVIVARKATYRRETHEPWPVGFLEMVKDTWMISPARSPKRSEGEPPAFPPELVRRLALLFTDPGDVMLDPMMGSGTSIMVAVAEGRRAVGCDRSPTYLQQAAQRVAAMPLRFPTGRRCTICNGLIGEGRRSHIATCSNACRQRAYRQARRPA